VTTATIINSNVQKIVCGNENEHKPGQIIDNFFIHREWSYERAKTRLQGSKTDHRLARATRALMER